MVHSSTFSDAVFGSAHADMERIAFQLVNALHADEVVGGVEDRTELLRRLCWVEDKPPRVTLVLLRELHLVVSEFEDHLSSLFR